MPGVITPMNWCCPCQRVRAVEQQSPVDAGEVGDAGGEGEVEPELLDHADELEGVLPRRGDARLGASLRVGRRQRGAAREPGGKGVGQEREPGGCHVDHLAHLRRRK
jgi:hypothetical protein